MDPQVFGKYHLYERLAEGGMAVVFRAKLLGPDGFEKTLVVKKIRPELSARREFIDLFVAEAKVTVSLTHANIVPVYELGMVDGVYFIALELIDGPPLSQLIEKGPLSPPLAAYVVEQVLRGLDYAHRRGVVHRDLSAANVLCSRDGEVKIVDFGIAGGVDSHAVRGGSRGYVAPEQEAGERCDTRSDLYSVGVLLWELCAGRRYDVEPIEVPATLRGIIQRATERRPDDRFPNAATILAQMTRFLREGDPPTQVDLSAYVRSTCPDVVRREDQDDPDPDEVERAGGPVTKAIFGHHAQLPSPLPFGPDTITFATRIAPAPPPPAIIGRRIAAVAAGVGLLGLAAWGGAMLRDSTGLPPPQMPVASKPSPPRPEPKRPPFGRLVVRSDPSGAEVTVNGHVLGTTPVATDVALDAPPRLRLRRRDFVPIDRTVSLLSFSGNPPTVAVDEHLRPLPKGLLTLGAKPWAHVTIDGDKKKDTPIVKLPLSAGPHQVHLSCPPTGRELKFTVMVDPGDDVRRLADMTGEPHLVD